MQRIKRGIARVQARVAKAVKRYRRRRHAGHLGVWSIGIYAGPSPLRLQPQRNANSPVLAGRDVTDLVAMSVADPFMIRVQDNWHLFCEVVDQATGRGLISHATSPDGQSWQYQGRVLEEPFHLSYPYVFEWEGAFYMIPETKTAGQVRLYRATAFPAAWRLEAVLIDQPLVDPSLFRHGGRWWMYAESDPNRRPELHLFGAESLTGPWTEHPLSPVRTGDLRESRPAGRVICHEGSPVRFAQRVTPFYGIEVRAFVVEELTATHYRERPASTRTVIGPGRLGWNRQGMHHLDAHQLDDGSWLACVDGWRWNERGRTV